MRSLVCAASLVLSIAATLVAPSAATHAQISQPAPDKVQSSVIHIAVPLPLSGPRKSTGEAIRQRIDLMVQAINAQGGVLGRNIEFEASDDGCGRESAEAAAKSIATKMPAVVIGHPCAPAAVAAAATYRDAGIVFMAAAVRHPALTTNRIGDLVFRAAGRDDRQGRDAGHRLRQIAGPAGPTVIVHDRTTMARTMADEAARSAAIDTASPAVVVPIVASETDYTTAINRIAAATPNAVLFVGFPAEAAIILRQMRQRRLDMPFIGNDALGTDEFANHAGELLDSGVQVMMPVSINRDSREEHEGAVGLAANDAAAALLIWRDAVIAVGSTDAKPVAEQLSARRQHLEEIVFDSNGDAIAQSYAPFERHDRAWRRIGHVN